MPQSHTSPSTSAATSPATSAAASPSASPSASASTSADPTSAPAAAMGSMSQPSRRRALLSLLPLVFFLFVYLGGSFWAGDFYKIPMSVAFLAAAVMAVAVGRGSLRARIDRFSAGASEKNIMLMVWIYIMAGAFAYAAKQTGAVDATVSLALRALPSSMVFAGLFLSAAFVSVAIGTSVGTVVALVPIAAGIAQQTGQPVPMLAALVVGGSYFGDNLSFISDTTIAATQTQGVAMADKFRQNIRIVWPAMAVMLVYCIVKGVEAPDVAPQGPVSFAAVVPYAAVIALSVYGLNVLAVLALGIVLAGLVGCLQGSIAPLDFIGAMGQGVAGMGDIIIVAMLAGGMLELIKANGGLDLIIRVIQKGVRSHRGAEAAIGALVAVANLCTANNTVAIITVGRIARGIAQKFGVDPRRTASLLDTFACCVQGLLPYGVQMLLAASLAGCSPIDILAHLYYPVLLGLCALASIVFSGRRKQQTSTSQTASPKTASPKTSTNTSSETFSANSSI